MFFFFKTQKPDEHFSWIIAKNPTGAKYERSIGGESTGRHVVGEFLFDGGYSVITYNNELAFFEEMRARNEPAYVRAEPWVVCPSNLKGMGTALKSALAGSNTAKEKLTNEEFNAPKDLAATIGPFPGEVWTEFFEGLGLKVEIMEEGTSEVRTLILKTIQPMSVTHFLQKIYIGMMVLTLRYSWSDSVSDAQVEKYISLTKGWLDASPHRDVIVKRLAGYKRSLLAKFEKEAEPTVTPDGDELPKVLEPEERLSLHRKRHKLILEGLPSTAKKIVDMGSGEGQLLADIAKRFPEATLYALDGQRTKIWRAAKKVHEFGDRVVLRHLNLLYPDNLQDLLCADALIASEVIEHMHAADRAHFVHLISDVLTPTTIFLTTPNVEYNPELGMEDGQLRHHDHKIEYTTQQFWDEVVAVLGTTYNIEPMVVAPEEAIQPSFCIKATRKADVHIPVHVLKKTRRTISHIRRMGEGIYFPETNVHLSPSELRDGMTTHTFLDNSKNIFYLGPMIAPTDYLDGIPGGPFLEHPAGCFKYFRDRGLTTLIEEPKYMGSRAYILAFCSKEKAASAGFDAPIVINARSGGRFFKDQSKEMDIWESIKDKIPDDYIILDAEIMPWKLKAGEMIAKDFTIPGEAALLWRKRFQPERLGNVEKYLKMVRVYAAEGPLEVRPFQVLASGKIHHGPGRTFEATKLGQYRTNEEQLREIARLQGDIVKPCAFNVVDLQSPSSCYESIKRWEAYCADGGEGFVYKTTTPSMHGEGGYPYQSAIKVRGREYLRIIYGMDYLEEPYFQRLKSRDTRNKRLLAVQEQEIANQILRAFINNNEVERLRATAAFLGLERAKGGVIDQTL